MPGGVGRVQNSVGSVRDRVLEFLANYGEKGFAVLRAAVEATLSRQERGVRLGDFSFRDVQARLKAWGIEYNPSMLLRILERGYGIIETSYRSGNQHWWRFIDLSSAVEALEEYEHGVNTILEDDGDVDVEQEVLRAQIAALGLDEIIEALRRLALKPRLSRSDRKVFEQIAFSKLDRIAKLIEKAEEYSDVFEREITLMKEAIRLASKVSRKLLSMQTTASSASKTLLKMSIGMSSTSLDSMEED